MSEASYEQATEGLEDGVQPKTYCLSSYFEYIVERLLETTDRPDAAQVNTFFYVYCVLNAKVHSAMFTINK